jgi:hypothetical protein
VVGVNGRGRGSHDSCAHQESRGLPASKAGNHTFCAGVHKTGTLW